jgi:4-amino-4-deoxy-L-arabinose transferase-like glycosyltransferase
MEIGSLIATYDPLLVVFWAGALLCLERALFASELQSQRRAWFGAGVLTGLGFLSKHTMLLLLPCLVLFLLWSPEHRFWLRRWEPYAAFALCLLMYGGVFYWNATHHWWTFGHLFFLA